MPNPDEQDAGFGESWNDRQHKQGETLPDEDGLLSLNGLAPPEPEDN